MSIFGICFIFYKHDTLLKKLTFIRSGYTHDFFHNVIPKIEQKMQQSLENEIWDCIVVGAGIEGSNTARYSASLGKETLCLEQVCSSCKLVATFDFVGMRVSFV